MYTIKYKFNYCEMNIQCTQLRFNEKTGEGEMYVLQWKNEFSIKL